MSVLWTILLLSVMSQAFAQDLLQSNQRIKLNIIQPNKAPSNSPISSPNTSNAGDQLEVPDLNSPDLSKFSAYNLQVQQRYGTYPRLFDVSFPPNEVRQIFHNEAVFFALENGLYEPGNLPHQLATAAAQALPYLTPRKLFKATSDTLEIILNSAGIATENNYQVLVRVHAKAFEDAMNSIGVNDAQSALHAVIVGAGAFFRSLSLISPDNVRFALSTYADQFLKVPPTGGIQQK